MRKAIVIVLIGIVLLVATAAITSACGGFFCTTVPIDQSAERIIFTVNGDGTITAIVGINYVGEAEEFSWVVPVPSIPEVDVADVQTINTLQQVTSKNFTEPPNYCSHLIYGMGGLGGGGDMFLQEGNVGPYDYAILGGDIPGDMILWLRENGYRITEEMEPLVALYVDEGMFFLAMKLSQDSDVGDIQPVAMTYEAEKPTIPIRLTAVAAVEDMPILTWIFADTQYVPDNFTHAEIDYTTFRGSNQIREPYNWYLPPGRYTRQLNAIQEQHNGLAFITEYAQPSEALFNESTRVGEEPGLVELIERFPYVTYLRAQMSPEQMTLDPSFVPAPDAEDMPRTVDLGEHVDPLQYWGCSTRTIFDSEPDERLPQAERFEYWDVHVRYPEGWIISEFEIEVSLEMQDIAASVTVFSPETVDEATLRSFFDGEIDFPMLVMTDAALQGPDDYSYQAYHELMDVLGMEREPGYSTKPTFEGMAWNYRTRFELYGPIDSPDMQGVFFNLLTTEEDWAANQEMYNAMLRHADSYQYFAHPDLRHTLFLESIVAHPYFIQRVGIGYPDGWIEGVTEEIELFFTPEDMQDDPDAPRMQIYNWLRLLPEDGAYDCKAEVLPLIGELFNLPDDVVESIPTSNGDIPCTYLHAQITQEPILFEHDGRKGYVKIRGGYLIETSAPLDLFEEYETDLFNMANGILLSPPARNALG